jgi:hypothetical protein
MVSDQLNKYITHTCGWVIGSFQDKRGAAYVSELQDPHSEEESVFCQLHSCRMRSMEPSVRVTEITLQRIVSPVRNMS